jgi:hypothetical protein
MQNVHEAIKDTHKTVRDHRQASDSSLNGIRNLVQGTWSWIKYFIVILVIFVVIYAILAFFRKPKQEKKFF